MSDYIKSTNFAVKDALPTGNSGKVIKGTELDSEFNSIADAIESKADSNSPTFTGTPTVQVQIQLRLPHVPSLLPMPSLMMQQR